MPNYNWDTDWTLISFEPKKAAVEKSAAASPSKKSCPKCGKVLGKGGHFHTKACKVINDDPR